jgi:hypothetical protein
MLKLMWELWIWHFSCNQQVPSLRVLTTFPFRLTALQEGRWKLGLKFCFILQLFWHTDLEASKKWVSVYTGGMLKAVNRRSLLPSDWDQWWKILQFWANSWIESWIGLHFMNWQNSDKRIAFCVPNTPRTQKLLHQVYIYKVNIFYKRSLPKGLNGNSFCSTKKQKKMGRNGKDKVPTNLLTASS